MTLLSKHEKRDSGRLPIGANLSESLILCLFLFFFTCFVTEDIPSPHAARQWLECWQYTGTCQPPQYTGIYRYSYSCLIISHSSRFLQHKSAYRHQKLCRFVNDALRVQRTWRSIAGEPLHAHPSDLPILCFRIQCKKVFSDLVSISSLTLIISFVIIRKKSNADQFDSGKGRIPCRLHYAMMKKHATKQS